MINRQELCYYQSGQIHDDNFEFRVWSYDHKPNPHGFQLPCPVYNSQRPNE